MIYKKNYTPSCIEAQMNKVDINSIHISVFTMPKFPDSNCHKKIKRSPDWCKNPIWWIKRGFND